VHCRERLLEVQLGSSAMFCGKIKADKKLWEDTSENVQSPKKIW